MIFLGLGSSIGEAQTLFKNAQTFLEANGIQVLSQSKRMKNPPQGGIAQNEFTNAVWKIDFAETKWEKINWILLPKKRRQTLKARKLLKILQNAENNAHRQRAVKWADRTLDLDILMFHDLICHTRHLHLPHPRIRERDFVLKPWQELVDKSFNIPQFGTINDLIINLDKRKS